MVKVSFTIHPDVKKALENRHPVLALESTILAHGMPFPDNYEFAKMADKIALDLGVVPATIAILNGEIKIGLNKEDLEFICKENSVIKTSLSDLSVTVAGGKSGATTVSATMHLASLSGVRVFSTGGIGGVHRYYETNMDLSQDLIALSNVPMIVVSAGAKAILDLPKTLEALESLSVSVIGYKTNEFPAFYSRSSGLKLNNFVTSVDEIIKQYSARQALKINSSILVVNPIKEKDEVSAEKIETYLKFALNLAREKKISGKGLTPFLLKTMVEQSNGECLRANIALALNNIQLGSEIALRLANK
jgi:pseudouridine-5'-phosphate glycosidase